MHKPALLNEGGNEADSTELLAADPGISSLAVVPVESEDANFIANSAAARLLRIAVEKYPLKTFALMGLTGDLFVAMSGEQYNPVRFIAGIAGAVGCVIILVYTDNNHDAPAPEGHDNQDRDVSRFARMLDFRHHPLEAGFGLGLVKSTLVAVAGSGGNYLDRLTGLRPIEVVSALTDTAAMLIGNLVDEIPADTPLPAPAIDMSNFHFVTDSFVEAANSVINGIHPELIVDNVKDYVQRHPLTAMSVLFHVGGFTYMLSGLFAGDYWAATGGLVYTSGNFALGWASKRNQGVAHIPE